MVYNEDASLSAYESAPNVSDVEEYNGKLWIPITLAKKNFLLPLVNVAPLSAEPVAIGYLMPDPTRNPNLAVAASRAMRWMLEQAQATHIFMPPSSKSEWFIRQAASNMFTAPRLVRLTGGVDESEVVRQSKPGSVISYTPVTGTPKFIGLPHDIEDAFGEGVGKAKLVLADDVWTTGATLVAMEGALNPYLTHVVPDKIVLAREAPAGINYPPQMTLHGRAALALPEIMGLPVDMLTHISLKDLPGGIPAAIEA